MKKLSFLLLIAFNCLFADPVSIYKTLDPKSLSQLFAFHELYPDTREGKEALNKVLNLLGASPEDAHLFSALPAIDISTMITMMSQVQTNDAPLLTNEALAFIEKISTNLKNRSLEGHTLWDQKQIMDLPLDQIDLSRALFLTETNNLSIDTIKQYEAMLDLMALQISFRLKADATDLEKIEAINDFIFYKLHFRYPPHSTYSKEIDSYTFLSSVLDSRKGVCLGVSVLYLCLAQRLGLTLEAITPPGHIFLSYVDPKTKERTNIETTARGIHVDLEDYYTLDTISLQRCNMKEVIGYVLFNQASTFWSANNHKKAIELYEKAKTYIPDDPLIMEFLGYNYLFDGNKQKGIKYLKKALQHENSYNFSARTTIEDYLNHRVDIKGLKNIFSPIEETKESILAKQEALKKTLKKYPNFRSGIFLLASSYLQMGRTKEATAILDDYLKLDPENVLVHYYQSLISMERMRYKKAHFHAQKAKEILQKHQVLSKKWKFFELHLKTLCHPPQNLK
jgi:tetratricopeptide (TPR) repeat protein